MSESHVPIIIEFEGGVTLTGLIDRVLAPLVVDDISFGLPMEGRAAMLRGEMKITLNIRRGNQKSTKEVKRAQIAYMPLGDSLCIYLIDMKTFSPVNIIGQIDNEEALDNLASVRRGSKAIIRLNE